MNIQRCYHKECLDNLSMSPRSVKYRDALSDAEYKHEVSKLLIDSPCAACYECLLVMTMDRLVQGFDLSDDELKDKVVLRVEALAREHGRRWMNPVNYFSREGILGYLNHKIDDQLTKVYGNKTRNTSFDTLLDTLCYLTLYQTVMRFKRKTFVGVVVRHTLVYWLCLIVMTLAVSALFWVLGASAVIYRQAGPLSLLFLLTVISVFLYDCIRAYGIKKEKP